MGLDMYLERTTDTYKRVGANNVYNEDHYITTLVAEQIGYWRKFNALHNFIVDKFNEGVDNCRPIDLYEEQVEKILETLKAVQADHSLAETLLPTGSGFFFGSTEYNDWYFADIDDAIEVFTKALTVFAEEPTTWEVSVGVRYRASW